MKKKEYRNSNGEVHREDGPAIEYSNGTKYWYLNGKRHRENGPVVECGAYKYWFLQGEELTEEEFNARIAKSQQPQSQLETEVTIKDIIDSNLSDKHKLEIISKLV